MSILMPVQRGLIGWYDARAYWQFSGTSVAEIADLSGNLHSMKRPDAADLPGQILDQWGESSLFLRQVKNNIFGDWPAFIGSPQATYNQGYYCAPMRLPIPSPEASVCVLCRITKKIGLNSTVPVSFGLFAVDNYFGPLASGYADLSQWTVGHIHPYGKLVDWNSLPTPATRIIIGADGSVGGTTYFRQDGVLQEEIASPTAWDFSYAGRKFHLEMGRGHPWSDVGIALFYNVKLTTEECEQNEQFMDWTTSASIPYIFKPNTNPLP